MGHPKLQTNLPQTDTELEPKEKQVYQNFQGYVFWNRFAWSLLEATDLQIFQDPKLNSLIMYFDF